VSDVVRYGVIGAGSIGRIHADNLTHRVPGAALVAVADVDENALNECAAANNAEAFTDYRDLLERSDVDAVVICTLPDNHAEIIEAAADAGKQIVCEKPLERTLEAANRAIAAVERAGVRLFVAFNRRYDPHYLGLREAVNEGRIGRPLTVRLVARDPVEWMPDASRPAGDLFLSTAIHDLDFAGFLMDDWIESVYAVGGVMHKGDTLIDDPDTAVTTLRFAGGAHGVIETSRVSPYGYDQRVEVLGDRGPMAVPNPSCDAAH
jgi:myo-inositol 2-dehydrogenase/D-chiro-inositol 1-dehydrogenase